MKGTRRLGLEYEEGRRREARRWAEFYSAVNMQDVSFNRLVLPEYCVGYDRLIAVHYSVTTTAILRLISVDREWRVERGVTREDLLNVRSRRYDVMQGRESYAILTKDRSHPDMMFVEVSELPTRVKAIGLQEYLLMVW